MTPDQIESIRAAIRLPVSATEVSRATNVPLDSVYEALVRLEGRGEAFVRLAHTGCPQRIYAEWVQA